MSVSLLLMRQIIAVFGSRFKPAHRLPGCSSLASIDPTSFSYVTVTAFTSLEADIIH
ncbi:hypothetical protein ACUTSW_22695 [Serratia sp. TSA_198.1]|jgi:hypothetical protein|uniref:hypothetical protein n=1 Tax=Serratia TaxID=613 RepID=UPI000A81D891|nr:hypothetical protein [Serratia plymuthica]